MRVNDIRWNASAMGVKNLRWHAHVNGLDVDVSREILIVALEEFYDKEKKKNLLRWKRTLMKNKKGTR